LDPVSNDLAGLTGDHGVSAPGLPCIAPAALRKRGIKS
jgi:hypothetical protein